MELRTDADLIIRAAIERSLPDSVVRDALRALPAYTGRLIVVSAGKAAWRMAHAAAEALGSSIDRGLVITKYGHSQGDIPRFRVLEAAHPVPDANSFAATEAAIQLVSGLSENDLVLFLLSGGGSALFEKPLVPESELVSITEQLLKCGADITEINAVRKKLSAVKGGKFARLCAPARVWSVVLSDVLGDAPDMIASGPTCPDPADAGAAVRVAEKYGLTLSDEARALLSADPVRELPNAALTIGGSVRGLCRAAAEACKSLGYRPILLTGSLDCEAREAGQFLASIAREHAGKGEKLAFLAGGETVVHVRGTGLGGRNQELALAAALKLEGIQHAAVFSVGSDGTDGPTDAAGGYADGETASKMRAAGLDPEAALRNNDAYHALEAAGALIVTGPTGTNVNDVSVALIGA